MEIKEVQLNRLDGERQDGEELSAKNPLVPRRRFPRKVIFSIALATIILLAGLLVFFTPSIKVLIRGGIGKPEGYPTACTSIETQLPQLIKKGNYCSSDSDCVLKSFGCPFGCSALVNKNYGKMKVMEDSAETYRKNCSPCLYDCVAPKEDEIACQGGKCADLRDAKAKSTQPSTSPGNPQSSPTSVADKYDIDTDGDSIPDFMETATGFDPNKDECLLAACEGYNANGQSKTKTSVVFILDSSGSMAGVSGASRKIDAAKNALKRYIAQAKADTTAGLMVYGHKGSNNEKDKAYSCSQIEVLYPLGVMDKDKFTAAVDSFQPVGWTPIGNSLRLAGKSFGALQKDDKNIILLVSDGVETCDTDPLGAAKELQNMGLKIQIDVIGFDLEPAAKEQLQKVAEIGGGKYYNAQTSEEFDKVMIDWFRESQNSRAALSCKTASAVSFIGCVSHRTVSVYTYLTHLQGSVLRGFVENYGVTAIKGEDTNEKINKINKRIREYDSKAQAIFSNQGKLMWEEWQANYEKIKSGW